MDAPELTREHTRERGYTYTFLTDPDTAVIRRYDVLHEGAGERGAAVARPAEFLIDRNGIVRWRNLTEDFRVRLRPEEVLSAARSLKAAT